MEFSRQESWTGLPFPPPGNLPNQGIEPGSPALADEFLTTEAPGKHRLLLYCHREVGTKCHQEKVTFPDNLVPDLLTGNKARAWKEDKYLRDNKN